MFCPKCKAEYREGILICAPCHAKLVERLPEDPSPVYVEYEEILGTYNAADIAIIKSILDAEKITYFFQGEHFTYMRPLADPARLLVKKDQAGAARELLKGLQLSFTALNLEPKPATDF